MLKALLSGMKTSESDLSLNPAWLSQQQDRLLGYEVLRAFTLAGFGAPMEPATIAEKTATHKFVCSQALNSIKRNPNTLKKLTHA